jgi:hypothetical protein
MELINEVELLDCLNGKGFMDSLSISHGGFTTVWIPELELLRERQIDWVYVPNLRRNGRLVITHLFQRNKDLGRYWWDAHCVQIMEGGRSWRTEYVNWNEIPEMHGE